MVPLIAYTNRASARPGEQVEVKVSCAVGPQYQADFVQILSADPNPESTGVRYKEVPASFSGTYASRVQTVSRGSYALVELTSPTVLGTSWTFTVRVQPWLLDRRRQVVASLALPQPWTIAATEDATILTCGASGTIVLPAMSCKKWYELRIVQDGGNVSFYQIPIDRRDGHGVQQSSPGNGSEARLKRAVFAASFDEESGKGAEFFNGRLEDPALLSSALHMMSAIDVECGVSADAGLAHWWDFSVNISGETFLDRGIGSAHGRVLNLPTRAVCGTRWSGAEMNWKHAPREYAAIHFHEDDLYDCEWKTDFTATVPDELESGIYGIRLRCEQYEDVVPVFVLPPANAKKKAVALLVPTFTYQVYANFDRANFDEAFRRRRAEWGSYPHHPAEHRECGLSTYDRHSDGSGVVFSSARRPVLTDRPGYLAYVDLKGSGIRHLSADMHIVEWLRACQIDFDVVTDHDLHRDGDGF